MHIIDTTALISINATLIVQVVSFLLFLFVINRLMLQPLRKTMGRRDGYMEQMRKGVLTAEEELADYSGQIERRRSRIRSEAFEVVRALETEGREQAHEIFLSAGREIAAMREKAASQIGAQIAEAQKCVAAEVESVALSIMEQVLERRLAP